VDYNIFSYSWLKLVSKVDYLKYFLCQKEMIKVDNMKSLCLQDMFLDILEGSYQYLKNLNATEVSSTKFEH